MKNTDLRDCNDNMIFEGETLEVKHNGDRYRVMFGYYILLESEFDIWHYGFHLMDKCYGTTHAMPKAVGGKLKLLNISRAD